MKLKLLPIVLICSFIGLGAYAQTKVSGKVTDKKGEPLPGVNVIIKDSYDGASTLADGTYSFTTTEEGEKTIVANIIGFEPQEQKINLSGKEVNLSFTLKEKFNELKVVTISAGTIEASDEKRITILKPLDIVTTANAAGDIYGALKTLPGAQQVGESAELFVRGGSGSEAKTIIDGMLVANPYFSNVPDVASRGRFSPFLFKGTIFSTGGYSAQYGQAMSSVLVLESQDLPDITSSTLAISSVGIGASHNQLFKNGRTSLGVDANYTNLHPYYALIKENLDWERLPQYTGGSIVFRNKIGKTGMLKAYVYYNGSDLSLYRNSLDSANQKDLFQLKNANIYSNTTYQQFLSDHWKIYLGFSYAINKDKIKLNTNDILNVSELTQTRLLLSRSLGKLSIIRFGGEMHKTYDRSDFNIYKRETHATYAAGIVESDIYITTKLVTRLGVRAENLTALDKPAIAPRASVAYKTGESSQLALAYGNFFQKPARDFLWEKQTDLEFERADHYIVSFQQVTDKRTFRTELFYKNYDHLVKILPDTANAGNGYAQGFEVFWRDKGTFRYVDYWISYSYLDSKRNYLDFPISTTPSFVSDHNFSIVYKQFFPKISMNAGASLTYATGRPYYNPNNPIFLGDKTSDYVNLGINFSYLRQIKKSFTVFVLSFGNVLGRENVFSYRYSADGTRREPTVPASTRSVFIGIFMSFGQDRSNEVD